MTTYSISLDDVDLALLPLRTYKYNDFLKKEHFQFQVMKNEEEDPEACESTIFYKCHICAIDVPAAFAGEHTASLKHRANARIARVATQRTRSLITAHPPPVVARPAARFCENCATIADKNHNKTKEHRVAVMHDKLLWELMIAYVGDDKEKNESNEEVSDSDSDDVTVIESVHSRHYNGFATWNEVNNNKQEKLEKYEPKLELTDKEIDKKADSEKQLDKDNKPLDSKTNSSEVTNIETGTNKPCSINGEITQMTAKNDQEIATPGTPKATQDKIEYVEFVNKENKIVKVFSDYYHSFTRKGDIINCKVCNIAFNSDEVDSHMFSLKHLNVLPSAKIDEHCVRQIDDVFSHCIVCNQMIKNTNLAKHYLTIGHSQREKQLVSENPNSQATTSKIVDKPTNSNKTMAIVNKSKTPEVKNTQNAVKSSIDWPVIYPFETTKQGAVRCVICDCHVPNNPENRKEHLLGFTHVTNVKNKRLLYSEQESVNCCAKCDGKVLSFDSMTEYFNANHGNNPAFKLDYPYEATESACIARCAICDIKVTISPVCLKEHLDGSKHATKEINRKARCMDAFEPTKEASVARCLICDIKVPKTLRNLTDHIFGSNHIMNKKNRRETQQGSSQSLVSLPLPAKVTKQSASGDRTFESASDTIGNKFHNQKDYYFSWV